MGSWVAERGWYASWYSALHLDDYGRVLGLPEFESFDLRHPAHPEPIRLDVGPRPDISFSYDPWQGIAVKDDLLFAVDGDEEIWLLDLSQPRPLTWTVPTWADPPGPLVSDIAFVGDYLVVVKAVFGDLFVYDVSDPTAPVLVGTGSIGEDTWWHLFGGGDVALAVEAIDMYIYYELISVHSIDLSDPTSPAIHDVTTDLGWKVVSRVHMEGRKGVVHADVRTGSGYDPALTAIDLTAPGAPTQAWTEVTPMWDTAVADDLETGDLIAWD